MEKMWNSLDLKSPISDLVEYQSQDSYLIEKLRDFVTDLMSCANTLTCDHPIWREMNVFQNIQAKYKRILKCDKCLYYLHRVSHCLQKIVLLNLSRSYLDLADRFLSGFQVSRLPSRQQVEFVLLRTQAASKLLCEAIRYSQETFCFLIQKLKIGHLILDLVMAASVTARLHVMLKGILVQLCDVYQKVLSWRYKVKLGEFKWIEELNLPLDLQKWLAASESELNKPCAMSKEYTQLLTNILKNKNGNTQSDANSITVIDVNDDSDCIVVDENTNTDCGEVIPRNKVAANVNPSLTSMQKLFLKKILSAPSFEILEEVWNSLNQLDHNPLPVNLTVKKKKIISRFLARKKEIFARRKNKCKKNTKCKSNVRVSATMLAKYLAFTHEQINFIKSDCEDNIMLPESDDKLEPVNTIKELGVLYRHLCQKLLAAEKVKKHQKLKKIFRHQTSHIKLLKQAKQKKAAKDLVLCTSKIMLTLCQKFL